MGEPIEAKLEPDDVYWGVRLACGDLGAGMTRGLDDFSILGTWAMC